MVSRHDSKTTKVSCASGKTFNSRSTKRNSKTSNRCSYKANTNGKADFLPVCSGGKNTTSDFFCGLNSTITDSTPEIEMLFSTPVVIGNKFFL